MWYNLKENGEIGCTAHYQVAEDYFYTDEEIVWNYDGTKLLFKHETETEEYKAAERAHQAAQEVENLRRRRERECFPVVNRGAPWYERLTDGQREELDGWYSAWLDVTDTLEPPAAPDWL